jgi:predicted solute-binding protein
MTLLTSISAFGDSIPPLFISKTKTKLLKQKNWLSNGYFTAMIT